MLFDKAESYLKNIFKEEKVKDRILNKETHSVNKVLANVGNSIISISFPGYKAKVTSNRVVYDYRVDIKKNNVTTSLSHANIILDIYNKVVNGGFPIKVMEMLLIKTFKEGPVSASDLNVHYSPVKPSKELIKYINQVHGKKLFNESGSIDDLTTLELFKSIKWIVLQEDINYPIKYGYEGRKMPFARYMETLHVVQTNSTNHSLGEVIKRALTHSRPQRWNDLDYHFLNDIN